MTIYELNIKPEYLLAAEASPIVEEISRQELPDFEDSLVNVSVVNYVRETLLFA